MDTLKGYIERILFQNSENGYTVAELFPAGKKDAVTVVGNLPSVRPGETVSCKGLWKQHLVHGLQFEVKECRIEAPADVAAIQKYLGSGLIKGIGGKYATRIVDVFGDQTLNVIDQNPERLLEIPGIGKKRVETITNCWQGQKSVREVMIFLQSHGVSPTYAQKIFKRYGQDSIEKVKANPYQLAQDIWGIGFKTADSIAQKMGMALHAPERIDSGIEHVLHKLAEDGHVCYPIEAFLFEAESILTVSRDLISARLDSLKENRRIEILNLILEGKPCSCIWLYSLFMSEVGIAREVARLRHSPIHVRGVNCEKAIDWVQKKLNLELASNQKAAVQQALTEKIQIITGGPGTGKSTITKAILAITEQLTSRILLTAPTGRAAKRMTEITGKKAVTIHSLLEFDFKLGRFKRNRDNPLECDLLIIDEATS